MAFGGAVVAGRTHCQYQQVTPLRYLHFPLLLLLLQLLHLGPTPRPGVLMAISLSWSEYAPWERVKFSVAVFGSLVFVLLRSNLLLAT